MAKLYMKAMSDTRKRGSYITTRGNDFIKASLHFDNTDFHKNIKLSLDGIDDPKTKEKAYTRLNMEKETRIYLLV